MTEGNGNQAKPAPNYFSKVWIFLSGFFQCLEVPQLQIDPNRQKSVHFPLQ